jgi:hypothetical protein
MVRIRELDEYTDFPNPKEPPEPCSSALVPSPNDSRNLKKSELSSAGSPSRPVVLKSSTYNNWRGTSLSSQEDRQFGSLSLRTERRSVSAVSPAALTKLALSLPLNSLDWNLTRTFETPGAAASAEFWIASRASTCSGNISGAARVLAKASPVAPPIRPVRSNTQLADGRSGPIENLANDLPPIAPTPTGGSCFRCLRPSLKTAP